MERLKNMKESLINCVQSQMSHLYETDTEELGEAIDMIKDISEAIYYCTITEAMHSKDSHYSEHGYGHERHYDNGNRNIYYYQSYPETMNIRDYREGRSPYSRKMYMESKEMHHGKDVQMKELEHYMKELSEDITEMINDATPEEKAVLQQKLMTLAEKVVK